MEKDPTMFKKVLLSSLAACALLAAGGSLISRHNAHPQSLATATLLQGPENLITDGQWDYMPGAQKQEDGLHVDFRDFRIVEQDGSGGQPNPPLNLYGTHLQTHGDFMITTNIKDIQGAASIQLYAAPPIVSDEFRVEPKSLRLSFGSGKLGVERWDGTSRVKLDQQQPASKASFAYTSHPELSVKITRSGGTVAIAVNDQQVGSIAEKGVFNAGEVWFGASADTPNGHFTLTDLRAEGANGGTVSAVDTSEAPALAAQNDALQMLAIKKRKEFLIGADVALWAATSDPAYRARIFGGDFGIVTPENELKWQFVEPQPGVFDFHAADALVAEADKHHMQVHGHNLVFSEALPQWVQSLPTETPADKAHVKQVLIDHVSTLTKHFKGKITDWDINEVFADYDDDDTVPQTYTDNVFYRALGPDYIRIAAEAAKQVDPQLHIWINEYGADTDTGQRWQGMFSALRTMKQTGTPIDGFGFQAHIYDASTDQIVDRTGRAPVLTQHIQALARIGLMSRISEMDAPLHDSYSRSSQSQQFKGVLASCISEPSCKAFSMWSIGPTDRYQDDDHMLQPAETDSPFDPRMQPNQTYKVLQDFLRQ
jgi:endo-1,4-beta-xylanase